MPRRTPLPVYGNSSCTSWCAVLRWSARLLSISVIARASIARSPERTPRTRSAGGGLREAIESSSPGNDHASVRILQRHPRGEARGHLASLRGLFAMPESLVELFQQFFRSLGDHRARRKDRFRAGLHERVIILRRHDAADDDHDIVAALFLELGLQLRHQRQMSGRERRHAKNMNVVLDCLAGCLGRGCEKRTDIDVEAQVGECRSDDFLAAVVPVLPNLGDEQTRAATFGRFKSFNGRADTFNGAGHADLPLVNSCNRLDLSAVTAEYLFQ